MNDLRGSDVHDHEVQCGEGSQHAQRSHSPASAVSSQSSDGYDEASDMELEAEAKSVEDGDSCLICLGTIVDRSVLPTCLHSLFCFACIEKWINLHRRCPLCSADVGTYIIHRIRSDDDYVRHALPPLSVTTKGKARDLAEIDDPVHARAALIQREAARTLQQRAQHNDRDRHPDWREKAAERWNAQLARRRRIYRQGLYCLHVGSNRTTKLAPPPSPQDISATPVLQSTLLHFVRRELLAFPRANIDVNFLSNYILILLKEVDIRSDAAFNLLADFLDHDGAEHFCHELYTFLRFVGRGNSRGGHGSSTGVLRDRILAFDRWAQYPWPEERLSQVVLERRRKRLQREREAAQSFSAQPIVQATPDYTHSASRRADEKAEDGDDASQLRNEVIARRRKWLDNLDTGGQNAGQFGPALTSGPDIDQRARLTRLARERLESLHTSDKHEATGLAQGHSPLADRLGPVAASGKRQRRD